ncbi:MAG TPA: trimeric intracellular cation channel family protein [Roseiarcus sp.]|nr:trimeric intracellular cation channel family protein [Roseiarcus sp.]
MTVLDGVGSFVFALSGGLLGVQKRFDLFGVLVLSFVVAATGGIVRDLMIGAAPPAAIASWHTLAVAIFGGLLTFYFYPFVQAQKNSVLFFDAIGLAVFAVTGAQKALHYGIDPVMAAVLGMVSGIGGGIMRDILAGDIPGVLRSDLYAVAALAAAGIVCIGQTFDAQPLYPMLLGAAVCIFLRMMAIYRGWRVPVAHWRADEGGNG